MAIPVTDSLHSTDIQKFQCSSFGLTFIQAESQKMNYILVDLTSEEPTHRNETCRQEYEDFLSTFRVSPMQLRFTQLDNFVMFAKLIGLWGTRFKTPNPFVFHLY